MNTTSNEAKEPTTTQTDELEELVYYGLVRREGEPADAEERQGLVETALELVKAHTAQAVREAKRGVRIDEIKKLRRKMELSSYNVGMGAWTVLHTRQEQLNQEKDSDE